MSRESQVIEELEQETPAIITIDDLNHYLERVGAGIIRLMVNKVHDWPVYEMIVKIEDGEEYIICENALKVLQSQDDGESVEISIDLENAAQELEVIKEAAQIIYSSGIEQCCADIKDIALRPAMIPDFFKIKEPQSLEDCYEFTIKTGEAEDYVMVDDECPYILKSTALENGEIQLSILKPSEFAEIIEKINQKIAPVIAQESFVDAEIVLLTKDAELRQATIEDLMRVAQSTPACVITLEDDESALYIKSGDATAYVIHPNQIVRIDATEEEAALAEKSDRFMLLEAVDYITQACATISEQFDAIKNCYEMIVALAEQEDRPEFIAKHEIEEEGDEPYYTIEVLDSFYVMAVNERGCFTIFCQKEGEGGPSLLASQDIEPFIFAVNEEIQAPTNS